VSNLDNDAFYRSEQFQSYFNISGQSLIIKADKPHFTILAVSDSYLTLTHKKRGDLLNKGLFEVFPGSTTNASEQISVISSFNRAIKTKQKDELPVFKYEIFVPYKGIYETFYWSNCNEPLLDENGNVTHLINTTVNVTKKLLQEQALAEAQKQLLILEREQILNEELAVTNEELRATNEELQQTQLTLSELNYELEERVATRTKALTESESRFRNLVLQAPVGICMIKGDPFYVQVVNDSFLELAGKNRSDFNHQSYWEAIPEAAAIYEPIARNVVATGQTYYANEHKIMLRRNGVEEMVYANFVYEPIRDSDGLMDTILIVATEITEQVNARKIVEHAEESLRMATESAELGTWSYSVETGEFIVSARFKEIFGVKVEEDFSYENVVSLINQDYREIVAKTVKASFDFGEPFDIVYQIGNQQKEKKQWVRSFGKLINSDDKGSYITGVLFDITEQKQDEQRKSDFIAMVSHELKTPLTSLNGYLQMLMSKANKTEDTYTKSALDKSVNQIKKMTTIINGFLNVSRLESGKIYIDKQRFDMALLMKEIQDETALLLSSHQIIFAPVDSTTVTADRDKIGHVINNLLSNAQKYSPIGSTINVACVMVDGKVQVSVKDEGMGISAQDIDKLFDRYYRVQGNQMHAISGFGIGLYLCAEIIQRHQGKIWVESKLGAGSTFYFNLPVTI
jgi:two-component system sensor histidine kinase VicK